MPGPTPDQPGPTLQGAWAADWPQGPGEGGRRSQLPGWETEGRFPVTSSLPPCLISGAATDPVGRPWAEPLPCLLGPQQQHPSLLRSAGNCPLQIPALPSLPGLVCGLGSQTRALGRKGQPGPEATDALTWSPLQQAGHVHVAWSPGGCRTHAPSLACRFWGQRPWWRGACGQGCHLFPCVDLISHPLGNSPGRGTGAQPVCSPPPALPQRPPGAGPAWGGRRRSGGKERRLCLQSWLSRAALGNMLSQLGAVCCVVCVFVVLGGGVGRGDSCQSCSSQGLIRGDPSPGLACVVGHPCTPPSPSPLSLLLGQEHGGQ